MDKKIIALGLKALNNFEVKKYQFKTLYSESPLNEQKTQYFLVQDRNGFKRVLDLRKKVFVEEEGYPFKAIFNDLDKDGFHFIAKRKNELLGCMTIYLDMGRGLPVMKLDDKTDFRKYNGFEKAEIQKLAILPEARKSNVAFFLIIIAYEFLKLAGYDQVFIFTLKHKAENIRIYKKLGFNKLNEFNIFNRQRAVSMTINLKEKNAYDLSAKKIKVKETIIKKIFTYLQIPDSNNIFTKTE